MFKSAIFIVNTFILILFNIAADSVSVNQSAPERVENGNSFIVNVEINKGNTTGYAKYQVVLPAGVTAEVVDSKNAKFSLDNNKVKFVWIALNEESKINISYKVIVNDSSIKEVAIGGTFAYLKDNERQTAEAPVNRVAIGKKINTTPVIKEPMVSVTRKISPMGEKSYKVTVEIKAENVIGFAKIQDVIPSGATAAIDQAGEAVFTPVSNKVKFVWMNFPEDQSSITVSYLIDYDSDITPEINGNFAYLHKGESRKAPILLNSNALAIVTSNDSQKSESTPVHEKPKTPSIEKPVVSMTATPQETPKKTAPAPKPVTPQAENGIVFKVQIMAGHNQVNVDSYFTKKYNFTRKVSTDLHEGWHKYITGNNSTYKDARDLRNSITNNFNFRGPFVVAYNNGARITVQEALMATNQKWVN